MSSRSKAGIGASARSKRPPERVDPARERPASASREHLRPGRSPSPTTTASPCGRGLRRAARVTCSPPSTTGTPPRPEAVGQRVRFVHLGAEAGDGDQVEAAGQVPEIADVRRPQVLDSCARGVMPGERQQAEARQRGDGLAALDEARQRQPQPQQLRRRARGCRSWR